MAAPSVSQKPRRVFLTAALLLPLVACAGRAPAPVATVQPKDSMMDCTALQAEMSDYVNRKTQLGKEKGDKVAQNIVAGTVGLVLFFPALFLMDFQGAAETESKALEAREAYLATLAAQRCGAPGSPVMATATPR